MSHTVYAKCVKDGDDFTQVSWRPWVNVKPETRDMLHRMILHRWVRNRGGVGSGEKFSVTVYTYDDNTPKYPNGNPRECDTTTYEVGE